MAELVKEFIDTVNLYLDNLHGLRFRGPGLIGIPKNEAAYAMMIADTQQDAKERDTCRAVSRIGKKLVLLLARQQAIAVLKLVDAVSHTGAAPHDVMDALNNVTSLWHELKFELQVILLHESNIEADVVRDEKQVESTTESEVDVPTQIKVLDAVSKPDGEATQSGTDAEDVAEEKAGADSFGSFGDDLPEGFNHEDVIRGELREFECLFYNTPAKTARFSGIRRKILREQRRMHCVQDGKIFYLYVKPHEEFVSVKDQVKKGFEKTEH